MQSAYACTDQNYHARNIPTLQCKTRTLSQSVAFVARSIQLLINMFNYCGIIITMIITIILS